MNLIAPTINDEKLIEIVSQYIDLKVIPYGQATRTRIHSKTTDAHGQANASQRTTLGILTDKIC